MRSSVVLLLLSVVHDFHHNPPPSLFSLFQNLKKNVDERQAKLSQAKGEYKTALRNLEMISDEIHERRRNSTIGPRGRGVGAEGDSVSGDDISSFKMESDVISSEYSTTCLSLTSPLQFQSEEDVCHINSFHSQCPNVCSSA